MEVLTYLFVVMVCLLLSAFFSGSETALLRVRPHELEEDIRAARGPAVLAVHDLVQSTSRLLVTILLGNNVVNTMGASVAAALAVRYLGEESGIAVATGVMTVLIFVFCEVLPKAVAARHPRRVAYAVGLPLYLLHQIFRPVHVAYDWLVEPLVRALGGASEGAQPSSAEEIMHLARLSTEEVKSGTPMAIISAVADAVDTTVSEVMVPRTEILAFPVDTPPSQLLEEVLEERYTRVPIYEETIDRVLGMVHLKDLVEFVREGGTDLRRILKPVLQTPERKPILQLLAEMQRAFVHMAIVKDEFGVTLGLVTQEDILEELVGEIRDEFDREELLTIRPVAEDRYQAPGRVKVADFNRETGWKINAERGDTLAGLIFNTLGRAPRKGERVSIPGYDFIVVDMSGSRVTQVEVVRRPGQNES